MENEIAESITNPIDIITSFKLTLKTQESSRRLAVASKFRALGLVHPGMGSGSRVIVVLSNSVGSVVGSDGSEICWSAPSIPRQPDRSKIVTIRKDNALFFMLARRLSSLNLFSLHSK